VQSPKTTPPDDLAHIGEWLRRASLALTAALMVSLAYWPSDTNASITELVVATHLASTWWVALTFVASLLAVFSWMIGGWTRVRWSWCDAAVLALMFFVGLSAREGLDTRIAINLTWGWLGVGMMYALIRALPRTPQESSALAAVMAATAASVALYGLYQFSVEFPELREIYRRNPEQSLINARVPLDSPSARQLFENRLMGSNEIYGTFSQANSLAGWLVGSVALVFALAASKALNRERRDAIVLAIPGALLLVAMLMTKSRSAAVGLFVVALIWGFRSIRSASIRRFLAIACLAAIGIGVAGVGLAYAGVLDRQVLTESFKSLSFRRDYWQGAWGIITERPDSFWLGTGPGNFSNAYLRFKSETASESIADPHNMLLEAWAASGIGAAIALLAALGLGFRETLGPSRAQAIYPESPDPRPAAPRGAGWILLAGFIGWPLSLVFEQMAIDRWTLLAAGYWLSMAAFAGWSRRPIPGWACGLAAIAVAVNLLAAGGIGFPAVALGLWAWIALGQNLRTDRRCGHIRDWDGRAIACALAIAWSALAGLFYGTVTPFWRSEAMITAARRELSVRNREPNFARAEGLCMEAIAADRYSPRPFLAEAAVKFAEWVKKGKPKVREFWVEQMVLYQKALEPPRDPTAISILLQKAAAAREFLRFMESGIGPKDMLELRSNVVSATREASRISPTDASIQAQLASASAEIGMFSDAVSSAKEALRLDEVNPHADRKLPDDTRAFLKKQIPEWERLAKDSGFAPVE
jgi:hypothetical protein